MSNAAIATFAALFLSFSVLPVISAAQTANQETTTSEGTTTVEENDLAIGVPEDDARRPGETYVKEKFGDWSLRCIVLETGDDPCQMYQLLSDETGQPVVEFTMFRLPEGRQVAAGATVVVPLETGLQQQLSIKVDDEQGKRYPYAFCNQVGCYARIGLTLEDVESYKRGAEAVVSLVPALSPDQTPLELKMSLSGFTAAFEEASVLEQ